MEGQLVESPGSAVASAAADESRAARKQRTRRAILDAALGLTGDTSLVAVSLRQVAKEVGIVPTAFYRHFDSVESLGLALVDESFVSLRELLRDVRSRAPEFTDLIDESLTVLVEHVRDHPAHYSFIARERMAGPARVREAIRREIDLITRELASDVARLPGTEAYSHDHLHLLADLIVSFVVITAERLVDDPDAEARVLADTRTQLRMLLVGAVNWSSGH
jgi:AcrR family transcriptional regulator